MCWFIRMLCVCSTALCYPVHAVLSSILGLQCFLSVLLDLVECVVWRDVVLHLALAPDGQSVLSRTGLMPRDVPAFRHISLSSWRHLYGDNGVLQPILAASAAGLDMTSIVSATACRGAWDVASRCARCGKSSYTASEQFRTLSLSMTDPSQTHAVNEGGVVSLLDCLHWFGSSTRPCTCSPHANTVNVTNHITIWPRCDALCMPLCCHVLLVAVPYM